MNKRCIIAVLGTLTMIDSIVQIIIFAVVGDGTFNPQLHSSENDPQLFEDSDPRRRNATVAALECKCVNCEEDELCGGLWKANKFPPLVDGNDDDLHTKKIHIARGVTLLQ